VLPSKVDLSDLTAWKQEFGVTHPVLRDSKNEANRAFAIPDGGRPQSVVIDRGFDVVFADSGTSGHEEAESIILDLLGS
jgi:hypothetical protein